MAAWLGPGYRKRCLVLAQKLRPVYSFDDRCPALEGQTTSCFSPALALLFAVYTLLHYSKRFENGALDLGQHKGAILLVACFGAFSGSTNCSALAASQMEENRCGSSICLRNRCWSFGCGGNIYLSNRVPGV